MTQCGMRQLCPVAEKCRQQEIWTLNNFCAAVGNASHHLPKKAESTFHDCVICALNTDLCIQWQGQFRGLACNLNNGDCWGILKRVSMILYPGGGNDQWGDGNGLRMPPSHVCFLG